MSRDSRSSHENNRPVRLNASSSANAGYSTHCRYYCFTITPTFVVSSDYACSKCGSVMSCDGCGCCRGCGSIYDDDLVTTDIIFKLAMNEFLQDCD